VLSLEAEPARVRIREAVQQVDHGEATVTLSVVLRRQVDGDVAIRRVAREVADQRRSVHADALVASGYRGIIGRVTPAREEGAGHEARKQALDLHGAEHTASRVIDVTARAPAGRRTCRTARPRAGA